MVGLGSRVERKNRTCDLILWDCAMADLPATALAELLAIRHEFEALERRLDALSASAAATLRGTRLPATGARYARLRRAREIADALRATGEPEHKLAGIVALRLGITTRHARRLLGREATRPERGGRSFWVG
jgi:hypothetical protein